jgi:hypothetical protein
LGFFVRANAVMDRRMTNMNNMRFFMRKIIVPRVDHSR